MNIKLSTQLLIIFVVFGFFVQAVEDAFVPVIKFKFDGIEVGDMCYLEIMLVTIFDEAFYGSCDSEN